MTLRDAQIYLKNKLSEIEDGNIEAGFILESVTGLNRTELLFNFDRLITDEQLSEADEMADRRLSGEPIQYILGCWDFMGFSFEIGEGVLIP